MSCGVGCRHGSDPTLLWLWCRLMATAPIGPLAWEPPYAAGAALEMAKRQKQKQNKTKTVNFKLREFHFSFVCLFFVFCPFRATPAAYRGSQARGRIGAAAPGLCQSHSNEGSEPRLRPTPQLMATPDPLRGQGLNPLPHGS